MIDPLEPCLFRFVLGGQECKCLNTGNHSLHRVLHPHTGEKHVFQFEMIR